MSFVEIKPITYDTKRINVRIRSNSHKPFLTKSIICVLENPANPCNIAGIIRTCYGMGLRRLYVVSNRYNTPSFYHSDLMKRASASASLWMYVKVWANSQSCLDSLQSKHFVSVGTTPRQESHQNFNLCDFQSTHLKHLAIWFGNERHGLSPETIQRLHCCIQIPVYALIDSFNVTSAHAMVLYQIFQQRATFYQQKIKRKKLKKAWLSLTSLVEV